MVQTIVKAHGGEIKVGTREGQGTTFIIQLPVQRKKIVRIRGREFAIIVRKV
jgi:signal transduction histidine kinase